MNTEKTIIIAGGSWGCGEWRSVPGVNEPTAAGGVAHPGLQRYLREAGYNIINLCQPGGANSDSANRINSFLWFNQRIKVSLVIVFQTEWVRDVFLENRAMIDDDLTHGYDELKNRILTRFYRNLSQISQFRKVPIYLVGGCSDTLWINSFEQEYPGLNVACQSLTNLLTQNNHRNTDPTHCIFGRRDEEEVKYIKSRVGSQDIEHLLEDIDRGQRRLDVWAKHKEYFYPDGFHANREGHRILFEFLRTQIPDL
jgi:hypothetical protein